MFEYFSKFVYGVLLFRAVAASVIYIFEHEMSYHRDFDIWFMLDAVELLILAFRKWMGSSNDVILISDLSHAWSKIHHWTLFWIMFGNNL